jgi:uncharacterized membrane protein
VTFAHPLPWWVLPFVLAAIAAVAWLAYRGFAAPPGRRLALTANRFVTLLLLTLFLMRPVRTTQDGVRDAVVPILVDASRSMSIDDADGRTRIDRAREIVTRDLLPRLSAQFHVELFAFGDGLVPSSPDALAATARRSDLAAALTTVRERFRGQPIAGIVLLSDGGDTSGADGFPDRLAPVFTIGVGAEHVARDREVLSVTTADVVLDESRIDLAVSAVSHGHGAEPIALRLLENGRPIEVRRVTAADGIPIHETFHVSPGSGAPTVYTVEIPAASDELVPENNARSTLVQPPSRVRRVLFVEGAPGFEHSFLKRAWTSDPGLEIDSIVRKGKNEQGSDTFYIQASRSRGDALTSGYPQRLEDLFGYDALVLANVEAPQLSRTELEMTRAFVATRGGGLLVLGSRSFEKPGLSDTPLEEVLPLRLSDRGDAVLPASSSRGMNRVTLTLAGEAHPVMQLGDGLEETRKRWDAAPALSSAVPLGAPRPGATVLAVTGGSGGAARALVAVQRYGEGRAMVFTGEAAWRWRMLLPSSDKSYDRFWRQAARWLALTAADPVAITIPAGGSPGDSLAVRIAVRNAAFVPQPDALTEVRVTAPDGRIERLRAAPGRPGDGDDDGRFVARFRPEQSGVYRVTAEARRGQTPLGSASASLLVGGADLEMTDPRLNMRVLQRLALASGGRVVSAGEGNALLESLRGNLPGAKLAMTQDLWHNAWSFTAIVVLLLSEWILRRRWGLR